MQKPISVKATLVSILACGAVGAAFAFNLGGHYFSVLAVFSSANAPIDAGRATEAFCSELPDMSKELDAITLRADVFWSPHDRDWGSGSRCTSPVSRHMVQVQFYLHALTGQGASVSRASAERMLKELDTKIGAGGTKSELANLRCERGFAAHLLGDTFAHVQLKPDPKAVMRYKDPIGVLYDTGLGHFRDGVNPDYMLWRTTPEYSESVQWVGWVKEVANHVDGRPSIHDAAEVLQETASARSTKGEPQAVEAAFINELKGHTGKPWLSELPEAKHDWMWSQTTSCETQIKSYFDALKVAAEDRPNCAVVWSEYIRRAQAAFVEAQPDGRPPSGPDPSCVSPVTALSDSDKH